MKRLIGRVGVVFLATVGAFWGVSLPRAEAAYDCPLYFCGCTLYQVVGDCCWYNRCADNGQKLYCPNGIPVDE